MNRRYIRVNIRFVDRFETTLFDMDHSNHLVVAVRIIPKTAPPEVPRHYLTTADKRDMIIVKRIFLVVESSSKAMKEVKRLQAELGIREFRRRVECWGLANKGATYGDGIISGEEFFSMLSAP